jgi:glycyl-tRNA synthetase
MTVETEIGGRKSMDDIVALCKRRGFVYRASDIYGGINGFWDYGPLGVELKNNLRDAWWHDVVRCPPAGPDGRPLSIVGVDSAIIQNPQVWVASGHVGGFNDPMVDCRETKARYRADQLVVFRLAEVAADGAVAATNECFAVEGDADTPDEDLLAVHHKAIARLEKRREHPASDWRVERIPNGIDDEGIRERTRAPGAKEIGTLTAPRQFNLMFKTFVGAIEEDESIAYLRPETAQGIFTNFKNVVDTSRVRIPFGIAQIGKSFRNEVTPRNFIFRSREFEQMEMEWFCHPDDARAWYDFWVEARRSWWVSLGIDAGNLRRREHDADELSHYSTACADVEYRYPFTFPGFGELEGIAHRGCFDLDAHEKHARTKLAYFDQERNERYLPHVIEPAAGLTRGMLVLLCEAYTRDPDRPSKVFMKFHPRMAPIKAAVFPLVAKDGMPEIAERLYDELRARYAVQYDVKQSIGKRYARMDEAGTPYCLTIDSETLTDQTVTVRDRDTAAQSRIALDRVAEFMRDRISE